MYKAYWGMEFNPFDKEIPEKQFYKSRDYEEMTKRLEYLRNVRGIGLFTGLPGTGKTACQRAFAQSLNPNLYKTVYLPMTTISASEFYRDLAGGLGLEPSYRKIENFRNIQERIKSLYREQKTTLVIMIDEAQYLSRAILADLKMLMNFEMDSRNYAVLVLSGQPTLNNTLSMQFHEALRQRIVISYNMEGLTPEEVTAYAKDRMKLCGVTQEIFDPAALEAAYGCCGGSIRRLNTLLHRALIIGCEEKLRTVGTKTIMDAANEIDLV
ncbi:MAG: AAA family ATPase [Lachnospiraceae bacterium]|nr:AAA family ATPase [Lachnospiraceae bacterium]